MKRGAFFHQYSCPNCSKAGVWLLHYIGINKREGAPLVSRACPHCKNIEYELDPKEIHQGAEGAF